MAKVPGFAKAFAGRWRTVEMDIRLRCEAPEFFNTLLAPPGPDGREGGAVFCAGADRLGGGAERGRSEVAIRG